jgi:hypothetical protein
MPPFLQTRRPDARGPILAIDRNPAGKAERACDFSPL